MLIIYCITLLFRRYRFAKRWRKYIGWSTFLTLWLASYNELFYTGILQLIVLNFETQIYALSSILALIVTLLCLAFPVISYYLLRNINEENSKLKRFDAFVADYDMNKPTSRYTPTVIIIKKMLHVLSMVFFYYVPMFQVLGVWAINVGYLIFLIKVRPHSKFMMNGLDIFTELLFVWIHSLICLLSYNDYTKILADQIQETVGWYLLGLCFTLMGVQFFVFLNEQYEVVKSWFDKKKKRVVKAQKKIKTRVTFQLRSVPSKTRINRKPEPKIKRAPKGPLMMLTNN